MRPSPNAMFCVDRAVREKRVVLKQHSHAPVARRHLISRSLSNSVRPSSTIRPRVRRLQPRDRSAAASSSPRPTAPECSAAHPPAVNDVQREIRRASFEICTSSATSAPRPPGASRGRSARASSNKARRAAPAKSPRRSRTTPARCGYHPLPPRSRSRWEWSPFVPGIFPASISVAPNSPSARANDSDRPRQHARPRERQRDLAKHAPFRRAQRPRRLQELRIHLLERRARRQIHQRKRHHGRRDHRRRPRKHNGRADPQQQLAHAGRCARRAAAEKIRLRSAAAPAAAKMPSTAPSHGPCAAPATQPSQAPPQT